MALEQGQRSHGAVLDVDTVQDPAAAAVRMHLPLRSRILIELLEPRSDASLPELVGLTRRRVHDHLRVLAEHVLAHVTEERKWGGLSEPCLVATAASYLVSPETSGRWRAKRIAWPIACPQAT